MGVTISHQYESHRLRGGRVSVPGQIYHLRFSSYQQQALFLELATIRCIIRELQDAQSRQLARTLAFVVMPDHVHWLCELGSKQSLGQVLGGVKARTARVLKANHGLQPPIWQSGYFDRAIREESQLVKVARYIVANPLRKKLVEAIGDYPHWGAVFMDE